jgi:hypothetical protein
VFILASIVVIGLLVSHSSITVSIWLIPLILFGLVRITYTIIKNRNGEHHLFVRKTGDSTFHQKNIVKVPALAYIIQLLDSPKSSSETSVENWFRVVAARLALGFVILLGQAAYRCLFRRHSYQEPSTHQ